MNIPSRRNFLSASTFVGAGLLLANCRHHRGAGAKRAADEVTATEDLMREHGVLRRALIVYRAASTRLRADPASVPPEALHHTAKLFRSFGEDYHEKKLEEAYIFPAVKSAKAQPAVRPAAGVVDVLDRQHDRGREITDYVLAITAAPKLGANAADLANVLDAFARMYEAHTAIEDTVVFPAWKSTLTAAQFDEMGDKFEDIEHAQFGKDGFDDAVAQIASIEASLGLADLAQATAPPPPSGDRGTTR